MHKKQTPQSGSGIVTTLVIAFAGAAVALAVTRSISNAGFMATFVSGKLERETIAQMIQMNTSCSKTFPSLPACTHNSYITLISKAGTNQVLVQSDGTTVIGGYNVRARCVNQPSLSSYGLDIRIAKLSSAAASGDPRLLFNHTTASSFQKEAVSKLPLGWSHPKSPLFAAPGLAPCAAEIAGSAPSGEVPLGGIIMWSGALVPNGWALCNGQTVNGRTTPDLRDRFIVGSGGTYPSGATGGSAAVALTQNELPPHRHFTTSSGSHFYSGSWPAGVGPLVGFLINEYGSGGNGGYFLVGKTAPEPNYFPTSATGTGAAHENRPPYYALAFIMRVL